MKKILFGLFVIGGLFACGDQFHYVEGPQGPKGATGATGATGSPGVNGAGCSVTQLDNVAPHPNGGALINCENGTQAAVLNGSDGTPGTVVSSIQFCPSCVTTYATVFSEVGYCVSDTLYAVYSPWAALTALPPGTYTSNNQGCSCNFTVTSGCNITN